MKRVIVSLIVGMLIGSTTNTFAAVGDIVEATFAEFNYRVNGEDKTIETPTLVDNGKSYLPTTEIANMLGYDVTYKADSRTIEFNKSETTQSSQERILKRLNSRKEDLAELNKTIETNKKEIENWETKIRDTVEELKANGATQEQIESDTLGPYNIFKTFLNNANEQLAKSEQRKAELEKEIADLEAQLSQ